MFGKTKDTADTADTAAMPNADIVIDDFFGDEAAVAEAVRIDGLHQRLTGVEQQINSQFTSMAAYAQIAQEQVELVRSEAQHSTERSEQRVIGLIERERSDRMTTDDGSSPALIERIDALEVQVGGMREAIAQCLSNQKALADAITDLFSEPTTVAVPTATATVPAAATALEPEAPADTPLPGTDDFMGHGEMSDAAVDVDEDDLFPAYGIDLDDTAATHADVSDDDLDHMVEIATHDDEIGDAPVESFDVFAAPDIATIEPMTSLPAPVTNSIDAPFAGIPAPTDGPIAALSLD